MLDRRPVPVVPVHDCELCRALLALAESAVANRAAAERRRVTIHLVEEEPENA